MDVVCVAAWGRPEIGSRPPTCRPGGGALKKARFGTRGSGLSLLNTLPIWFNNASGTKTRSCGPHVLVDEPPEEIAPFDVGHTGSLFDGRETLGYPKLQASMRTSPVVVLHIDPKDVIEMA